MEESLANQFKSPEQGAATTVWGAVAKDLGGSGGMCLEDCQIAKPWDPSSGPWASGYASWAYDEEREAKLWQKSLELVRMVDDA
jgi:hypothetical protein